MDMKKLIFLLSLLLLVAGILAKPNQVAFANSAPTEDSIRIWCSPQLSDLTLNWLDAYSQTHPQIKIIGADSITQTDKNLANIGLFTKDEMEVYGNKYLWKMVVGRDIIVPIMNSSNPFVDVISQQGIPPEKFSVVFTDTGKKSWGYLLNSDFSFPVTCHLIYDETTLAYLADFLQTEKNQIHAKEANDIHNMLINIQNDIYAIGFCRLAHIVDIENQKVVDGIKLIPIDVNGNHTLDYFEDIYKNAGDLARGVWIGKYPHALYSNIYAVADNQPTNSSELAFVEWLLTDGQKYLYSKGYSELVFSEIQTKVQSLYNQHQPMDDVSNPPLNALNMTILLVLIVAVVIVLFIVLSYIKTRKQGVDLEPAVDCPVFGAYTVAAPSGLFFDKSHTWAFMEKDGFVRIGIDDFLQHVIGPITKVKMKKPGEKIIKGDPILSLIQHGKQLEIYSPVTGTIKEINAHLKTDTSIINSSPYQDGWVYVIESGNWLKEIRSLIMGENYRIWLKQEFSRLKDFLSSALKTEKVSNLQLVMQDGGELNDRLLEWLGPEVWEEFQTKFINLSK